MYKVQLLSCIALTLALLTSSAPTSSSTKETQEQLDQLLLDLQVLLKGVNVTELKHLQCLEEELKPLEEVLNLAQGKNSHGGNTRESISNINVTVLKLKGSETFMCEYDETVTIVEFLNRWITFCQSIISASSS
ncbi:interleukin-2 isoform 2 precursor [Oryctolagus cuniculus]|uniref:Interleukin-2 n=1 Tax=Oryctolagus cuniculus TaxID=9986 RepID=Q9MZR9_RABIT|nr:interleukin-2 isoform 2 precursor [Oryctolagus cuniculus]AAF86652.1 interleukin 2 variant IL2delta2 [Oryctolagus cuniculus]